MSPSNLSLLPKIYNFVLDDLLYNRPEVVSLGDSLEFWSLGRVELESPVDEPALEVGGAYFPMYLA